MGAFSKPLKVKLPRSPLAVAKPFAKRNTYSGVTRIVRDNYGPDWWTIRNEVFKRDGGKCQEMVLGRKCGQKGVDVHHIVSLSRGGTTTKANLITVCKDHHEARHPHMRKG